MRILLVGRHHGREVRGATIATHGLARALAASGHDVVLLQSARREHRVGIDGVTLRYSGITRKSMYPLRFGLCALRRFDVVHTQDEAGAYLALRSRAWGLPLVGHLHPPRVKTQGFLRAGWRWRYIGLVARHAPRIVTPSRWLADALAARYGRSSDDFSVLHNGTGEHWFAARREPESLYSSAVRIVLINMKGVEVALRAFARVAEPGVSLEVYGGHRDLEAYRRMASELGVHPSVHFAGFVSNAKLPRQVAGADILLHPTGSESFGQVLAEAAALGIPAVASRVNAVPEVVEDGTTGLLCPAGDVDAFAASLRRLITDPGLRRKMGHRALRRAQQLWRWETVADRLVTDIYRAELRRTRRLT